MSMRRPRSGRRCTIATWPFLCTDRKWCARAAAWMAFALASEARYRYLLERIQDGKIVERRVYSDRLGMLKQLGLIPSS